MKKITIFFLICLLVSITVFKYFIGFIKPPSPVDYKLLSDYLPFYAQLFSTKTNDFAFYIVGLLTFFLVPVVLFTLWKFIRYKALILLVFIPFFTGPIKQTIDFSKTYFSFHWKELLLIALTSLIAGLSIKHGYKILTNIAKTLSKLFNNNLSKLAFSFVGFIIIFILLFNPKYKFSYQSLSLYGRETYQQFHHVNFFLAPINEVINGKTLLINANSQYGILTTYIPAIIFKIAGVSYSNFVLYNMIITIIYVCIFFLFLKKITNSYLLGIIGVLGFIKLALFRYDPTWEAYTLPSTTPLRYFFDIIVAFLIYDFFRNKFSIKKLILLNGAIILAFFYNPEFGIPIIVGYIACIIFDLFYNLLIKNENVKTIIIRFIKYLYLLIFFTVVVGGIITLFSYLKSGQLPNWGDYIKYILFYSKGFDDIPMPIFDFYYLPLFIYIISYYYIFIRIYFRKITNVQLMIFLLIYGLLTFIYYINLSEPNHLLTVIHPSLLLVFILFGNFKDCLPVIKHSLLKLTGICFVFFVIFFPVYFPVTDFIFALKDRLHYRYVSPMSDLYHMNQYHYWSYPGTDFYLKDDSGIDFKLAADKIRKLTKDTKNILILSRYDTLLYVMSGKTSLLDQPILEYSAPTYTEANRLIGLIFAKKPKYIFIYSDKYNQMQINVIESIANIIKKHYSFTQHAGAVDVYKIKK